MAVDVRDIPSRSGPSEAGSHARAAALVLGLLLAIDLGFILFHILFVAPHPVAEQGALRRFSLYEDGGIPEQVQYLKWAALSVLLFRFGRSMPNPLALSLALVFALVMLDDALQLHEGLGRTLSEGIPRTAVRPFRPQDIGELGGWAVLGSAALVALVLGWRRSGPDQRRMLLPIGVLFVALVGVGVGLDLIHSALPRVIDAPGLRAFLGQATGILEDGGEMVIASLLIWTMLRLEPSDPQES